MTGLCVTDPKYHTNERGWEYSGIFSSDSQVRKKIKMAASLWHYFGTVFPKGSGKFFQL